MLRKIPTKDYLLMWMLFIAFAIIAAIYNYNRYYFIALIVLLVLLAIAIYYKRSARLKTFKFAFKLLPLQDLAIGYSRLFILGWVIIILFSAYQGYHKPHSARHLIQAILNNTLPAALLYYIIGRLVIWVYLGFKIKDKAKPASIGGREIVEVIEGSYNNKPGYLKVVTKDGQEGMFFKSTFEKEALTFPEVSQGKFCLPNDYWVNEQGFWTCLKFHRPFSLVD